MEQQEAEQEKKIKDIEHKIEEVMELLALPKDLLERKFEDILDTHKNTRNSKELAFMPAKGGKHKNLAVRQHSKANLDLIEAIRTRRRFLEHPDNLLEHLDKLTDKLLQLVQTQGTNKKRKTSKN